MPSFKKLPPRRDRQVHVAAAVLYPLCSRVLPLSFGSKMSSAEDHALLEKPTGVSAPVIPEPQLATPTTLKCFVR